MAKSRNRFRRLLQRVMYNMAHRKWELIVGYAEAYGGRYGIAVPPEDRSRAGRYTRRYPCTLRRLNGLGWVLELDEAL